MLVWLPPLVQRVRQLELGPWPLCSVPGRVRCLGLGWLTSSFMLAIREDASAFATQFRCLDNFP